MKTLETVVRLAPVVLVAALTGCLSSVRVPDVSCWSLEYAGGNQPSHSSEPRFGVARVTQVVVRAPYGVKGLAVLRANGTVAFDPYNEYAALPAALMKGVVEDALAASGLFSAVVGATSAAGTSVHAEVTVSRLALDCRAEGSRRAVAELDVCIVDGRNIVARAKGAGDADAADGRYGAALSRAVSDALAEAFNRL